VSGVANAGVLAFKNGTRITRAIKQVWDEQISIEPSYADEFNVISDEIACNEDNSVPVWGLRNPAGSNGK
jgi:hypothetical protein